MQWKLENLLQVNALTIYKCQTNVQGSRPEKLQKDIPYMLEYNTYFFSRIFGFHKEVHIIHKGGPLDNFFQLENQ